MKVFEKIDDLKNFLKPLKAEGKKVGFVPTMGYLHEGHLSLINTARTENDIVGISIFVNPTQFGPNEDFEKYPRDLNKDLELAKSEGVDFVFAPSVSEMYPEGYKTYTEVYDITNKLCGKSRSGHFKGVTTVVLKLLNISMADRAYFGQKDAQQLFVIKRMVLDLNMDVEIIGCPIIRESDNLAKSSRNVYLSSDERKQALSLSRALMLAKDLILNGEKSAEKIINLIKKEIEEMPLAKIDYISVVDCESLEDIEEIKNNTLIALAVWFGKTRLIDNIIL